MFIIIGIVAIAAIIFMFVLFRSFQEKAREITNPQEYLKSQIGDIKKVVVKCIDENSKNSLNKLSFLCYKVKDSESCVNMMFTRKEIEDELGPVLQTSIKSCVDSSLESFRNQDYSLSTGDFGFNFVFSNEALLVTLDYPITLVKGNVTEVQSNFAKDTKTSFWKEVALASTLVNIEARGEIPDLVKMSSENLYFAIGKTQVTGGVLYMIVPRFGSESTFYFGVEK